MSQSKLSASPSLPLLFLILTLVCHTQQIINVGLARHGLPHFLLGGPVLGVQGLFLRRQLAALFFNNWAIFGSLAPSSKSFKVALAAR